MTWQTELADPSNDSLRQAGDIAGILAKYSAPSGPVTWVDAPFGEFNSIVGDDWLLGLTATQRNALFDNHMDVDGNVTLSNSDTRTALQPLLTQAQVDAFTASYSSQQTLAQTLGLPNPTRDIIRKTLVLLTDTPQYFKRQQGLLIDSIRAKAGEGALFTTSLANLQTIDSLLGV